MKPKNNIKTFLISNIALLISLCYVIHPLHQQLSNVWHAVSHSVEMPTYVLGHGNAGQSYANQNVHETRDHNAQSDHDHGILNFINAAFDSSESPETPISETKIDKHLVTVYALNRMYSNVLSVANFYEIEEHVFRGHQGKMYQPPQNF